MEISECVHCCIAYTQHFNWSPGNMVKMCPEMNNWNKTCVKYLPTDVSAETICLHAL